MDKITEFFEGIDLTKLVPEIDTLVGKVQTVTTIALLVGPVLMLVLGLWFFFLPVREANHRMGFRSWFGMGGVEVWRYTQRMAGLVWGCLGLVLTVVMSIICLTFAGKDLSEIVSIAFACAIVEAVLALLSYLVLYFLPLAWFDASGNRR